MFLLCTTALSVHAQAPSHPFFDSTNRALFAWNAGAQTLDAITTRHLLDSGLFRETSPVARLFEQRGWGGTAAYHYGLNFGSSMCLAYLMHRTGHHRIERMLPAMYASAGTTGGLLNLRFYIGNRGRQ